MYSQKKLFSSDCPLKVIYVVGARPNFMKAAPLMEEMSKYAQKFEQFLLHTGQHYDEEMSKSFFKDLGLAEPDIYLGIGSGTHAEQTGRIMIEFEKVCIQEKPGLVIVVGDVNSTIACALVAAKLCIPIAHVEAGLRSFDRTMPEEINRVLTDQISDYLFTTCEDADQNLIKEGIPGNKIFFVGNAMIDTLLRNIEIAKNSTILEKLELRNNNSNSDNINKYAVVTLHRPSNVDSSQTLNTILEALDKLSREIPIIFPAHPRTVKQLLNFNLAGMVNYNEKLPRFKSDRKNQNVQIIPPLGYLDFLCLMAHAAIILTDSGGIQEETTILGIPCLTLRDNTERPVTVKEGTNILTGSDPDKIMHTALGVLKNGIPKGSIPKYWDGKAAERIVKILLTEWEHDGSK